MFLSLNDLVLVKVEGICRDVVSFPSLNDNRGPNFLNTWALELRLNFLANVFAHEGLKNNLIKEFILSLLSTNE